MNELQKNLAALCKRLTLVLAGICLSIVPLWADDYARNGFEDSPYLNFRILDEDYVARAVERVDDLTRRHYGSGLRQEKEHDIRLIQRLLDEEKIALDDLATQQAAGFALGAMMARELDLTWIRYRDEEGVSRALHARRTDSVFFPASMISRRYRVGLVPDLEKLYRETDQIVSKVRALDYTPPRY